MESPHAREFRLRLEGDRAVEIAASAGGRRARTPEPAIFAVRTPPLTKTLDMLGACLRLLAFALLGSPLLILAKLVIAAIAGPGASDIVIPFFVIVVVAFFGVLNLSLVVFSIHWALRKRLPPARFRELEPVEGPPPSNATRAGELVCARGRVVPLDAIETVLRASDAALAGGIERTVSMCCFAVIAEEDATPAVIVHGDWAPLVPGPLEIRAGDVVRVTGVVDAVIANLDRFVVDGAEASLPRADDDPYRGGAPRAGFAVCSGDERVIVEKV